ncbi:hypothetical protein M8C21_033721 [Ambrosia artemisiifolia]|uniref:phospholipase D n=1 Tax=Ambrosia artemisiifolia TaxID=4212 RepID=A0AAD5GAM4_AMBAR|nr:hypothetical protein M8C21_033721 [Ambrosia artemisiifolia]
MQNYLNHFLGNIDIVNSREVCQFLEVSKLSFSPEYGPKLKEDYVLVQHLNHIQRDDANVGLFAVTCGNRSTKIRTTSSAKIKDWISAIYNASQKPTEGWCNPHRFGSFAPQRGLTDDGSQAQWFVDGQVAFEAIALAIANAKSEIYVTGWWLCPELYLKRPFHANGASRLDALFEAKAKEGVKKKLLQIHENVKVLRYPDHFAAGIYLSHHEKIVVVDHQICFLGGLDLCFGRYDTIEHKLSDRPPFIWPGKDYYNPRESEPNSWVDTMSDELDRRKYPRMPWHDVHCALWGPPCRDVARHFVQRWNHAKRNKAPNEQTIPLLMPQQHMVLPHYMGRSQELDIGSKPTDGNQIGVTQDSFSYGSSSQDIQFLLPQEADDIYSENVNNKLNGLDLRNYLDQSHDESVNHATRTAGLADDFDLLDPMRENSTGTTSIGSDMSDEGCESREVSRSDISQVGPRTSCSCQNQFFISGLSDDDVIQNRVLEALYRRILRAHKEETTYGRLGDDGPIVTSQVYVHSKVMIVDDRITLIGSSNINDRSLLGHRDSEVQIYALFYITFSPKLKFVVNMKKQRKSEAHRPNTTPLTESLTHDPFDQVSKRKFLHQIGVLIEDREFTESTMNGESWSAGKFTNSLRLSLWSEHLGLRGDEISQIKDPIADSTYKDLWLATAKENSQIYQDVFSCIPNDSIHSRLVNLRSKTPWFLKLVEETRTCLQVRLGRVKSSLIIYAFRQSMNSWKEKFGHTTIDLGVAPEKLEENIPPMEIMKRFMCHEDLRPMFSETEFYASPQYRSLQSKTDHQKKSEWLQKVKAWRVALRKAGSLTGMVLAANGYEAEFTSKIVNVIRKKLNYKLLHIESKLVGMDKNVVAIESWLQDPSPDAVILLINGMGGIGKTTISKLIYNSNYHEYDGSCFLANIHETTTQHNGLLHLQSQLLSTILRSNKEEVIWNLDEGIVKVTNALRNKKVLLVLDDITTRQQLTALLGPQQFYPGTKMHSGIKRSYDDFSGRSICANKGNLKVVGSLKILNLSYCMELIRTPDFEGLPSLESLFLSGWINLTQVCESIEHLERLMLLDISNCRSLKNIPCLPRSLESFKMYGCPNLGGLRRVQCLDSCSLSSLLVDIDVSGCNLFNSSFPKDWSNLLSLKFLNISNNHITSLPGCVKSLPSVEVINASRCSYLQSVLEVPKTVISLNTTLNMSLEKVQPTPNTTFLAVYGCEKLCAVEGCFKLESIKRFDRKIIRSLGLESISEKGMGFKLDDRQNAYPEEVSIKISYEFGIFSTYVLGKTLPCFMYKESRPTISFRVPSHPNGSRASDYVHAGKAYGFKIGGAMDVPNINGISVCSIFNCGLVGRKGELEVQTRYGKHPCAI